MPPHSSTAAGGLCSTAKLPAQGPSWVIRVVPTGSKASRHVRYASNSDRSRCVAANRRDVPQGDICSAANCSLFNHLVGAREQRRWHCEAKGVGSLEINDQL